MCYVVRIKYHTLFCFVSYLFCFRFSYQSMLFFWVPEKEQNMLEFIMVTGDTTNQLQPSEVIWWPKLFVLLASKLREVQGNQPS